MNISDKRRANLARIFINLGAIVFTTLVITNFTGAMELAKLITGSTVCSICFWIAIWIER